MPISGGQTIDFSEYGFTLTVPDGYSLNDYTANNLNEGGNARFAGCAYMGDSELYIFCYANAAGDDVSAYGEQELISMVTTLGHQLMDMEQSLRAMALQDGRLPLEDVIWRAYGVLSNARILPMNEFYDHWSNLRLGAALGLINLSPDRVDTLLDMAQPAHLCCWREEDLTGRDLDKARADRVRDALIS